MVSKFYKQQKSEQLSDSVERQPNKTKPDETE